MNPYQNQRWLGCLAASVLIHAVVLAWVEFSAGGIGQVSATIRVMLASAGDGIAEDTTTPGEWQPASASRNRDLFARVPASVMSEAVARSDPKPEPRPKPNVAVYKAPESVSPPPEKTASEQSKAKASAVPSKQIAATTSKTIAAPAETTSVPASASTRANSNNDASASAGTVSASSTDAVASSGSEGSLKTSERIDGAAAADTGALLTLLHQAIDRSKQYPSLARRQRREGTATVRFRLSPSGEMDAIDIDRSSGFGMLDSAAISAVSRVAPFAPARTLLSEATRFKVDVTFRLN